jgi:hypothetical protein
MFVVPLEISVVPAGASADADEDENEDEDGGVGGIGAAYSSAPMLYDPLCGRVFPRMPTVFSVIVGVVPPASSDPPALSLAKLGLAKLSDANSFAGVMPVMLFAAVLQLPSPADGSSDALLYP